MSAAIPALYAAWIDEVLAAPLPDETMATCDDCAMCRKDAVGARLSFHPDLKCCTYIPTLPNFLVGRILADDDVSAAAGRATIVERIRTGDRVTPLGLGRPDALARLYAEIGPSRFGRSPELRCPHYQPDGGRCGIWRERNAICATWFCKHSHGARSMRFWAAVRDLLRAAETGLARWCVREMTGTEDPEGTAGCCAAWGAWSGREAEFYVECARRVGAPRWADVARESGPDVEGLVSDVQEAFRRLTSEEPLAPTLRLQAVEVVRLSPGGRCAVSGYSSCDPLAMPVQLFKSLRHFDGRPTTEAVDAVRNADGLRLSEALVRKLVDFEILADDTR